MADLAELLAGPKVRLDDISPDDIGLAPGNKLETVAKSEKLQKRLGGLQEVLYAEHRHKVLVVLQGMDTSGKDGTVRHVLDDVSLQGVRVTSFKKPTETELDHDYLWRIHAQVPGAGELVIFNRSHYEDVLVVRVHDLVPEKVWRKRYRQINDFERALADCGVLILKFFLHISKKEQLERLQQRRDDPTKRWKFQHGDIEERELWGEYASAYQDALRETSTNCAPWYIVPADHKWYRNYVVAKILVDALEGLDMKYPAPDLSGEVIQ
jgi:PPK2 family polyphosphate:nucleotide phosphotransferase